MSAESSAPAPVFSVRVVSIDYYMGLPIPGYDPISNVGSSGRLRKVPVVRVFGSTPAGQKSCVHIHGVFTYFYIAFDDLNEGILPSEHVDAYITRLQSSINHATSLMLRGQPSEADDDGNNDGGAVEEHVYQIMLVQGRPFYGFCPRYKYYLKIYLYKPGLEQRIVGLLQTGAVMGRVFQTYESHIPYLLQFFIDYNIFGMDLVSASGVQFRGPFFAHPGSVLPPDEASFIASGRSGVVDTVWSLSNLPEQFRLPNHTKRQSTCQLEADIKAEDITNVRDINVDKLLASMQDDFPRETKLVQSLAQIWEDERGRRRDHGLASQLQVTPSNSQDRLISSPSGLTLRWREKFDAIIGASDADVDLLLAIGDNITQEHRTPTEVQSQDSKRLSLSVSLPSPAFDDLFSQATWDAHSMINYTGAEVSSKSIPCSPANVFVSDAVGRERAVSESVEDLHVDEQAVLQYSQIVHEPQKDCTEPMHESSDDDIVEDVDDWNDDNNDDALDSASRPPEIPQFDGSGDRRLSPPHKRQRVLVQYDESDTPRSQETLTSSPTTYIPTTSDSLNEFSRNVLSFWSPPSILDMPPSPPIPSSPSLPVITSEEVEEQLLCPPSQDSLSDWQGAFSGNRVINSASSSGVNTVSSLRSAALKPLQAPPTSADLYKALREYGVPEVVYPSPFYSNPLDAGSVDGVRYEYAGRSVRITTSAVSALKEFDPTDIRENGGRRREPNRLKAGVPMIPAQCPPDPKAVLLQFRRAANTAIVEGINSTPIVSDTPSTVEPAAPKEEPTPLANPPERPISARLDYGKQHAVSQIEHVTPEGTYQFKFSPSGLVRGEQHNLMHLTAMCLEIHAATRGELLPDPARDGVEFVVYNIRDDVRRARGLKDVQGLIIVRGGEFIPVSKSGFTGIVINHVETEVQLFEQLRQTVQRWDPDILIGYETQQLSWGYLIDRARIAHGIDMCAKVSRTPDVGDNKFSAEEDAWGYSKTSGIHISGRVVLNIWRLIRHELSLTSYTYESIAYHILHIREPHFPWTTLNEWYRESAVTRWRSIMYQADRVSGSIAILDKLGLIERTAELARVFGIDFYSVLSRGSQFRVESMMLRLAKPMNYIAISPSKAQVASMRAPEQVPLIMEPESTLYTSPVLVLDFQSLYPSIIIAYNMCYSTCLGRVTDEATKQFGVSEIDTPAEWLSTLRDDVHVTPNGVMFVKKNVRVGVLPRMLEEILNTRVMVKKAMKQYKDEKGTTRMLDHRQLGLKLIANVTYGYTSASFSGRMPCIDIADSIVATGRDTLERTIRFVESKWKGARVVYGDTDSLFVLLSGASKETAFRVGKEIAAQVSQREPHPMQLKFEKVYTSCILASKKRYVGHMYESVDQKEPIFDAKGIETVRRDGCPASGKILKKALTILFDTKDLSLVKEYLQRQWRKIEEGRISLQDFIIAKEVKLGEYRDPLKQPVALISMTAMAKDPRAEPRYRERVPYVVVYGPPGARLIDTVRSAEDFLFNNTHERLYATYYITKLINAALDRAFALIGVNVNQWYISMPHVTRATRRDYTSAPSLLRARGRIDSFYQTLHCLICDALCQSARIGAPPICDSCKESPQRSVYVLTARIREYERRQCHLEDICRHCTGVQDGKTACISMDCPVLYERVKIKHLEPRRAQLRELLKQFD